MVVRIVSKKFENNTVNGSLNYTLKIIVIVKLFLCKT
jgi:hypothetical protein